MGVSILGDQAQLTEIKDSGIKLKGQVTDGQRKAGKNDYFAVLEAWICSISPFYPNHIDQD